jgi:hypothetical protein
MTTETTYIPVPLLPYLNTSSKEAVLHFLRDPFVVVPHRDLASVPAVGHRDIDVARIGGGLSVIDPVVYGDAERDIPQDMDALAGPHELDVRCPAFIQDPFHHFRHLDRLRDASGGDSRSPHPGPP